MQRFQDMAVGYAYSLVGDFHLAEDAAQEGLILSMSYPLSMLEVALPRFKVQS